MSCSKPSKDPTEQIKELYIEKFTNGEIYRVVLEIKRFGKPDLTKEIIIYPEDVESLFALLDIIKRGERKWIENI